MRLMDKFRQFMLGRYGMDSLGRFLFITYLVLAFFNLFFVSAVLYFIGIVLLAIAIFRFLSRNTAKRYEENLKFRKLSKGIVEFFGKIKSRAEQNKVYCFKRCPNCGKTLRLPRKKGKHGTRCPVCGCSFKVTVWFSDK